MAKSNGKDAFAFPCQATGTTSGKPRSTEGVVVLFRPRRDTHLAAGAMRVRWHSIEPRGRFATVTDHRGGLRLHLVVEQMPNSTGWDWLVWQAGNARITPQGGIASSAPAATAAAEAATHRWRGNGPERLRST
jgi:hypothetical protein